MSTRREELTGWEVGHLLADPTRRVVFEAVRRAGTPQNRDEVSRVAGVNRRLAAFHLDRLAEAGLLLTDYARPPGRRAGPGAGRPAKRYVAAPIEFDLSVPPRHYDRVGRLLARAITESPRDAEAAARAMAYADGKRIGALRRASGRRSAARKRADLLDALVDLGYEPGSVADPAVRLCNCPFRSVADVAPDLVCGMNHELVRGLLDGLDLDPADAVLDPAPPQCCVTISAGEGARATRRQRAHH